MSTHEIALRVLSIWTQQKEPYGAASRRELPDELQRILQVISRVGRREHGWETSVDVSGAIDDEDRTSRDDYDSPFGLAYYLACAVLIAAAVYAVAPRVTTHRRTLHYRGNLTPSSIAEDVAMHLYELDNAYGIAL